MFEEVDVQRWAYGHRDFAAWACSPSKQQLLLRSTLNFEKPGDKNVDILFLGVSLMFVTPILWKLNLGKAGDTHTASVLFAEPVKEHHKRFILQADGFTGFVDAVGAYVEENTHDFWHSSMEGFVVRPNDQV